MLNIPLEVIGAFKIGKYKPGQTYYGPKIPDIGFLHVKAKGLPALKINDNRKILCEGLEIATAGFPMGTDALRAPGWLHQITPTLQKGIVSAVLPFRCASAHGFSINIMTQGGASGSPVFLPETGEVIGVLYGGLNDYSLTKNKDIYAMPTNISYVVPSHFISKSLALIIEDPRFTLPPNIKTLQEMLDSFDPKDLSKSHYQIMPISKKKISKRTVENIRNIKQGE